MKLIDQYVYAVVSKLPEKQRADIAEEIKTLIDDMKEKYADEVDEEKKVEKVLLELGDPKKLAEQYLDQKRYLIGPKNFANYIFMLKVVFGSVLLAVTIASFVEAVLNTDNNFVSDISSYFTMLISGLLQGFTWVTIIFAVLEYQGIVFDEKKDETWDLKSLSPIPNKKAVISPVESIASIFFITIFTFILFFIPDVIGAYIPENNETIMIPLFNLDNWENFKYLILGIFFIGILREILKLIYGKWNLQLAIYYSLLTIVSMVLFIVTFSNPDIWNANFVSEVKELMDLDVNFTVSTQNGIGVFIMVVVIINVIEIATSMYKGLKYNISK
ncbi:hypothetical protein KHQ81_11755 [Mycoplasmatota bacterium]|nr:hypothetical protein KHQ81_11755 [Mycoplasmatota bacterium]